MAITAVAHSGARLVRDPAIIGSIAALESWNIRIAEMKIKSARFCAILDNASDHEPPSRLDTPPRASCGSMSTDRICAKAINVGTPSAAVTKKIAWLEK